MEEPKNIIIRMPNWIGDLIMATPILESVRLKWPKAKITAMCLNQYSSLLEHNPHLDALHCFKRPSGWIHRMHRKDIIEPLCMGKYDLGILLTNSFSSAWWFWRGHVQNRIGFTGNYRDWLLTEAVPFPINKERQHLVITYKMLLNAIEIPLSETPPQLFIAEDDMKAVRELLNRQGVLKDHVILGINPGAAYGSAKCWLPERFREVTEKLLENPKIVVVYFGDSSGAPLVNEICKGFPSRVINLAGRTSLKELVALIKTCDVFLTNDSGPMHIASAVDTPLVALFGSTSDVKTGPYSGGVIIHKHAECSPCYKKICPIDFRCMKQIAVEEVYQKLQQLIGKISSQ